MRFSVTMYHIVLIALIVTDMTITDVNAQPRMERPEERMVLAQDTRAAGQEAEVIDLLNTSLESLSDSARRGRRVGGYVLLGLGIGSGIGGAATLAAGDSDNARIVGYSLLGGSVLLSGLSLLPFKLTSESERIYAEFRQMPEDTPEQVRQKFYYGDNRFEELASKRRRGRYIGGVASIAVGVTTLILIDDSRRNRLDTFAWPIAGGVVRLLIKTDEERRYETYRKTKEDIMAQSGQPRIQYGLALIPTGGIMGVMQMQF